MKRVLITGVTGFVGGYLYQKLIELNYEVWGTSRGDSPDFNLRKKDSVVSLDLSKESDIVSVINDVRPIYLIHLAGQSSVKMSWEKKNETFHANVNNTINLMEALKKSSVSNSVRVLTIGSSEEYGRLPMNQMPITEDAVINPISPYGISKATVSMIAKHYHVAHGMKTIHVRPFNHIGPGQNLGFVTTDFAKQIVDIERGVQAPVIKVGNLEAERDFLDVRDIITAYISLLEHGKDGEVYNICSGVPVKIRDILQYFINMSTSQIEVQNELKLIRPIDYPIYVGSNSKITSHTDWSPKIPFSKTLDDILTYFRNK